MTSREEPESDNTSGGRSPDSGAERNEDRDTARLIARVQAGESELFGTVYTRYFGRVLAYMQALLDDENDSEDAAQQAFTQAFAAVGRYEQRSQPFRAWLFTIVRNTAIGFLRKRNRERVEDPEEIDRLREAIEEPLDDVALQVLGWIKDDELTMFFDRLPLPQRQVLVLRYRLDLPADEIAETLGRTTSDIRKLEFRALGFLRDRMTALGRSPRGGGDAAERPASWQRRITQVKVLRDRKYALLKK